MNVETNSPNDTSSATRSVRCSAWLGAAVENGTYKLRAIAWRTGRKMISICGARSCIWPICYAPFWLEMVVVLLRKTHPYRIRTGSRTGGIACLLDGPASLAWPYPMKLRRPNIGSLLAHVLARVQILREMGAGRVLRPDPRPQLEALEVKMSKLKEDPVALAEYYQKARMTYYGL